MVGCFHVDCLLVVEQVTHMDHLSQSFKAEVSDIQQPIE